ncbi:MAG: aldo/keto reductase [Candidatus Schekmanbacteria bacterium]|nr:aldo/keto reductase [Candidatus Schekmanbacteria bacterium]
MKLDELLPTATLGRTGLQVSRMGIGGGAGLSSPDVEYAVRHGVNFLFWSSDLHHHTYRRMSAAVRRLCGSRARHRERIILAAVTYVDHPEKLPGVLLDQLFELGVDHVDIFMFGWVTSEPGDVFRSAIGQLRDGAWLERFRDQLGLRRAGGPQERSDQAMADAVGVAAGLKDGGYARFVGASFHDRALARRWLDSGLLDVVMLRYNPVHRGLESEPGPLLDRPAEERPGCILFKTCSGAAAYFDAYRLRDRPWLPSPADLYRFALRLPYADVLLTAPRSRGQIDAMVEAFRAGPLPDGPAAGLEHLGGLIRKVGGLDAGGDT